MSNNKKRNDSSADTCFVQQQQQKIDKQEADNDGVRLSSTGFYCFHTCHAFYYSTAKPYVMFNVWRPGIIIRPPPALYTHRLR
ncbi:hypothetical protein OUZ56_022767 [Daphnia magna]|uniref:Uncharacterized protein n=1 Tax=Daphnia magna TaxID=35525 RepID=A0ABR0AY40_9CRUS|nr:hypothetical protein OUZ56_022767 [Daphnia magna]